MELLFICFLLFILSHTYSLYLNFKGRKSCLHTKMRLHCSTNKQTNKIKTNGKILVVLICISDHCKYSLSFTSDAWKGRFYSSCHHSR